MEIAEQRMWRIENPQIRTASLDFTSSGQTSVEVSQLMTGDVVLMNALELMEWRADGTQVLICNHCGFPGCSSGGWIRARKVADRILLIPAFDEMETDEENRTDYAPPKYFRRQGTPYFDLQDYEALVKAGLGFPQISELPPLEMCEVVRLAQLEMPFRLFGKPPEIRLTDKKRALVVASSEGEAAEHLSRIEEILRTNYDSREPVILRPPHADEKTVYLFLDADKFTDWAAVVKSDDGDLLLLEEDLVIESGR